MLREALRNPDAEHRIDDLALPVGWSEHLSNSIELTHLLNDLHTSPAMRLRKLGGRLARWLRPRAAAASNPQ